jgi:hypothetical protein
MDLFIVVVLLIVLWGGGFAFHVGGSFVHLLLVLALVVLIIKLIQKP